MPLQAFIFRSEALKLYRQFLRTVRSAPPDSRGAQPHPQTVVDPRPLQSLAASAEELVSQIREGFRTNPAPYNDLYAVKFRLSDGRTQLRTLSGAHGWPPAPRPRTAG